MRRELFIHFSLFISFFLLLSVFKGWLGISYWPFWVGGLIGSILPDIDHLIYIFFLGSQELTSQRVVYLFKNRNPVGAVRLLIDTSLERNNLIFHSVIFQVVGLVLAFWVFTSSGSIVSKGLVLGLLIHLFVDELVDIASGRDITKWFGELPITLDRRKSIIFVSLAFILVAVLSFLA